MGQGLLGVVRNIGGALGMTVTSVFFEHRRAAHQLLAYDEYAAGTPEHGAIMQALKRALHEAGIVGAIADRTPLGAIRREMNIEAIAGGAWIAFCYLGCSSSSGLSHWCAFSFHAWRYGGASETVPSSMPPLHRRDRKIG